MIAISSRPTDELRATLRLVHRAMQGRRRLGWPDTAPAGFRPRPMAGDPDPEPVVLAALCVELSGELVARGASPLPCEPCLSTVRSYRLPIPTTFDSAPEPAGSRS